MKPVAIFRASASEGPAYFATWLDSHGVPWQLVALDEGAAVPSDAQVYSGLCFMGGPMSVNDKLPWIAPALELIRDAVRKDIPVLGHCLGGQLMSKAFGGRVGPNAYKEIGWGDVRVCDNGIARAWIPGVETFETFQWHGETFSIPPGATRVLENPHCMNQAFALGKHFAMQCHIEMTEELVRTWVAEGTEEMQAAAASPAVQPAEEIFRDLSGRLERLHRIADRIYDRWSEGLSRGS